LQRKSKKKKQVPFSRSGKHGKAAQKEKRQNAKKQPESCTKKRKPQTFFLRFFLFFFCPAKSKGDALI